MTKRKSKRPRLEDRDRREIVQAFARFEGVAEIAARYPRIARQTVEGHAFAGRIQPTRRRRISRPPARAGVRFGALAAAGKDAVLARYRLAVQIVVDMRGQGMPPARIASRAGLGHGQVYGMLRDAANVL